MAWAPTPTVIFDSAVGEGPLRALSAPAGMSAHVKRLPHTLGCQHICACVDPQQVQGLAWETPALRLRDYTLCLCPFCVPLQPQTCLHTCWMKPQTNPYGRLPHVGSSDAPGQAVSA